MTSAQHIPRVGIGCFVVDTHTRTFIFGRRIGSHGSGTWALPGGHLEHGETFAACATRETREETGLELTDVRFVTATNTLGLDGDKHYVTVFMAARRADETMQPRRLEPNRCEGWEWWTWDELREAARCNDADGGEVAERRRLFKPMIDLLEQRPDVNPVALMAGLT